MSNSRVPQPAQVSGAERSTRVTSSPRGGMGERIGRKATRAEGDPSRSAAAHGTAVEVPIGIVSLPRVHRVTTTGLGSSKGQRRPSSSTAIAQFDVPFEEDELLGLSDHAMDESDMDVDTILGLNHLDRQRLLCLREGIC